MKSLSSKRGFTVTELAIVIAVIAVLVAVLVPTFVNLIGKANESAALQNARNTYTQMTLVASVAGDTLPDDAIIKSGDYYYTMTNGVLTSTAAPSGKTATSLENGLTVYYDDVSVAVASSKININFHTTTALSSAKLTVKDADGKIVLNGESYTDSGLAFTQSGWFSFTFVNGTETYKGVFFVAE